jgi:hypothetical protein
MVRFTNELLTRASVEPRSKQRAPRSSSLSSASHPTAPLAAPQSTFLNNERSRPLLQTRNSNKNKKTMHGRSSGMEQKEEKK